MRVTVIGAGVVGLVTATILAERGADVTIVDRGPGPGATACSWFAGGMLAPWCEAESAEPAVVALGQEALSFWPRHYLDTATRGTIVIAPPRDIADLDRFARRTRGHRWVDDTELAALEPDLAGRFRRGLYFHAEAHLDPRRAITALAAALRRDGIGVAYETTLDPGEADGDHVLDCRGFAAASDLPDLRGVKGEMLVLRTREVSLSRPVRLLHPRFPLYIVPRRDGLFMVGATAIESADRQRVSVRSVMELLGAAYALHPAFGDAEVVELGTDVRPAFPDNMPALRRSGRVMRLNGFYRHGFLLSPAMARQAADAVFAGAFA